MIEIVIFSLSIPCISVNNVDTNSVNNADANTLHNVSSNADLVAKSLPEEEDNGVMTPSVIVGIMLVIPVVLLLIVTLVVKANRSGKLSAGFIYFLTCRQNKYNYCKTQKKKSTSKFIIKILHSPLQKEKNL